MTVHTIRVVSYMDRDSNEQTLIIGPYDTPAARDADADRLARVRGVFGSVHLYTSKIPPEAADHACAPDKVANVKTVRQLLAAVYGDRYDPAEDDDLIDIV